jgi:hypothetical protein
MPKAVRDLMGRRSMPSQGGADRAPDIMDA